MVVHFLSDSDTARELILEKQPRSILCVEMSPETIRDFQGLNLAACEATVSEAINGLLPTCDAGICSHSLNKLPPADLHACVSNILDAVRQSMVILYLSSDAPCLSAWLEVASLSENPALTLVFAKNESGVGSDVLRTILPRDCNGKPSFLKEFQLMRLLEDLDAAHRDARDLALRNEILVSQMESGPYQAIRAMQSLSVQIRVLQDRVEAIDGAVQGILSSRIWRTLVWIGALCMRFRG